MCIKNMINYNVDNLAVSDGTKDSCNKIVGAIEAVLKQQLDQKTNVEAKATYNIVRKNQDSDPCLILKHNAKFTDYAAYDLINNLDMIIEHDIKPNIKLEEVVIEMVVDIKEKKATAMQDTKGNKGTDNAQKAADKTEAAAKEEAFLCTKPLYTFDQVILDNDVKTEIDEALLAIECRQLVYDEWGFGTVEPNPKSILNFYGAPGTGKTMCAHAIAHKLGKPLLAMTYSQIESKYLGEATKNLKRAFDTAKETGAVLFFDESDSFLGKRIENVTQGSEQALNSLRSQMLIMLEEFNGVVIFATNLVTNYDPAFESRILKHIKFPLPNREARAYIIRKQTPAKLPLERVLTDEEYLEVSDLADGFSGREIKNAMLGMLLKKAKAVTDNKKEGQDCKATFSLDDYKNAFRQAQQQKEQLKNEEKERVKKKISRKLEEKAEEMSAEEKIRQKHVKGKTKRHKH